MGPSGTKRLIAVGMSGAVALSLLCVAAWMVFSGNSDQREPDGVQIIAPSEYSGLSVDGSPAASTPVPPPGETAPPKQIAVYITGEVVNPGVYTVANGERLDGVLRLAGGASASANLSRINLAAYVTDATHYNIPGTGDDAVPGESATFGLASNADDEDATEACGMPVNITTASAQCLETLPGIGAVRAEAIVDYREQEGSFASPEAITEVPGIGDGIYRRIADMITVATP